MKTLFQPTRLRAVLLSAGLSSLLPVPQTQAMTLQEAYALKGAGKVAAELLLQASGAPKGDAVVSALAQPDQADRLLTQLNALGLAHGAAAGRLVTGRLPFSAVRHLDALASLHSLRPSHALFHAASDPGIGRQGFTISQGDTEMYAAAARTRFGVDGAGVKVGVLSSSYDCKNGDSLSNAAASIQAGELPPDVEVLTGTQWTASQCSMEVVHALHDEGRAMLGVIHDLAPGAALAFHASGHGEADMANGIRALAEAGATVIVDDTTYLEEPVYQDGGVIADAVKEVVARGVAYVAAAGNFGRQIYEAPFQPSGVTQTIAGRTVELHDFDPGPGVETCQRLTAYNESAIALALHWDQPYASIGGGAGATSDLDLFLMDENCQQLYQVPPESVGYSTVKQKIGLAATDNLGGDPVETLIVATPYPINVDLQFRAYGLAIGKAAGPAPTRVRISRESRHFSVRVINGLEKYNFPRESVEYSQAGPGVFGHSALPEVITVGAVRARIQRTLFDTPYFGAYPGKFFDTGIRPPEPFSALGGTELLFDDQGNPLPQPVQRHKPDVSGVDGADTFHRIDWNNTGIPFFGTSAAAAHVGGLVALARQAAPGATPAQIAEALRATAVDLNDTLAPAPTPGFDFATGHGLADGENLIARLLAQPETPRGGNEDPVGGDGTSDCAQPTVTLPPGARYRGTKGNDVIRGAEGHEIIRGRKGQDILCGGAGDDKLLGGPGRDVLVGGPGNDVLVGGPGRDVFRFRGTGTGADRIQDLGRGDVIEIVGRDANGDGTVDINDSSLLDVAETPSGTVITFRDESGDRILVRGRKPARVFQALRVLP